jgi:hypothetical protein
MKTPALFRDLTSILGPSDLCMVVGGMLSRSVSMGWPPSGLMLTLRESMPPAMVEGVRARETPHGVISAEIDPQQL